MQYRWTLALAVSLALLAPMLAFAQGQSRPDGPAPPAPRWPDGRVRLSAPPGEKGLWLGGIVTMNVIDNDGEIPYQPWAEALVRYRGQNPFEPHTRCKPSGGTRQFVTPYGVEILEMPELERVYVFDIGGPHTYRIIYTDGRQFPEDLSPSYYGYNIGRWEGDTFVVESTGYNERFWFRARSVHTEQLRLTERFTRMDANTIRYEVTVNDPGAYTAPWTGQFNLRWIPDDEMFEFICQDNNLASELMVGAYEEVDRSSRITP